MRTHNLCFEQKYEKYHNLLSEKLPFLVVKFSVYLNRRVFVMFNVCPVCFPISFRIVLMFGAASGNKGEVSRE